MTSVPPPSDPGRSAADGNRWRQLITENPGHSQWYIERFRTMAERGQDIVGEARMVDAMLPRGAHVLDAGCGPGRIGGHLASVGHRAIGVDLDPELIKAAQDDHPQARWICDDLAGLDLARHGITDPFDVIVCAGNVMTFLDPATRQDVLAGFARHLAPEGRAAIGFGAGRGYPFEEFGDDVAAVGLATDQLLGTWDLRPFTADSDFLVALLRHA